MLCIALGNSDIRIVRLDETPFAFLNSSYLGTWWQQIPRLTDTQFNDVARK